MSIFNYRLWILSTLTKWIAIFFSNPFAIETLGQYMIRVNVYCSGNTYYYHLSYVYSGFYTKNLVFILIVF